MVLAAADAANADQIAYWNGAGGRSWVARQAAQEASLAPVSEALLLRAAPAPGERVVDVGCGMGATTEEIARRVGPQGHVLGIDISEPMLAQATSRLPPGSGPVTLLQADATAYPFPPQSFDLAVSRFGVMFFAEPARSFANLRRALRPGGRLAFACWRTAQENPWVGVPLKAALEHVPPPPQPGPEEPGMFSFGAEARVRRILGEAGFAAVALEPHDFAIDVGRGRGLDDAAQAVAELGPASRALQDRPPDIRAAAAASIRRALEPYAQGGRIALAAAIWIVTAANP